MDFWWPGAPRSARIIAVVGAVALLYGTTVHIVELVAGRGDPYPTLPGWLGVSFVSLTVLDPFAAALLLRCKRSGLIAELRRTSENSFIDLRRSGDSLTAEMRGQLLSVQQRLDQAAGATAGSTKTIAYVITGVGILMTIIIFAASYLTSK